MSEPLLGFIPESVDSYSLDQNLTVVATMPSLAFAPTSITSAGATATVTAYGHGLPNGATVTISGASPTDYNGSYVITLISVDQFSYTFAGSSTSPASGSILITPAVSTRLPASYVGITVCPAKDGGLWVLYDDTSITNGSVLRKYDPTTGQQLLPDIAPSLYGQGVLSGGSPSNEPVLIGERGAFKSLMDIGCGELLTVNRNTHQLIAVKVENVTNTLTPGSNRSVVLTLLSSSGFTATASKFGHGFTTGMQVVIAGADQAEYNGTYSITVVDPSTFTYTFSGSATPTATGTITATEVASTIDIGKIVRYYNLYVDPLDAAVNQAATRLLYIEGDAVKLWDLEIDDFIRTIVSGIGGSGGGGGTGGGGRCTGGTCTGTPDPTLPAWFLSALTSLGATNCVDESLMGTQTMKDACWANGYAIQVTSGCAHRARLYYQGAGVMSKTNACGDFDNGDYSTVVNLVAANHCDWAFL